MGMTPAIPFSGFLSRLTVWHAVGIGVLVRVAVLVVLPDQDFPDARAYVNDGRALFRDGFIASIEYMPLYPIWTFITGGGLTLRLADIALSSATIWLVWRLSHEIFAHPGAALLAAFAAAVWPHFAFYAVSGLTETAFVFIVCLGFLLLYRDKWLAAAVCLVLSILIRPSLELLLPILMFAFASVVHRTGARIALTRVAILGVVYLVVMAPWWVHQHAKYGAFVRLNLGDGIVLYSGNNAMNRTGGGITDVDVDLTPFNHLRDQPVARNEAMKQAAIAFIGDNPIRFIELAGLKFVRFWRLWPHTPQYQNAAIIVVSLLSYGVMLLATIGFLIRHARAFWRPVLPILLYAGYLTAVHMVTIGSIRYRFPLEPFLIILGSYVIVRIATGPRSTA